MAKPSSLPRWAETAGGASASNIVEPNSGKKDTGYTTGGDIPPSGGLNWFMRLIYKWCQWADAFANADGTLDFSQLGAVAGTLRGAMADGASAVGIIIDTVVDYTNAGAKLLIVKRAGVEKAYVDKDGKGYFAGVGGISKADLPGVGQQLSSSCGVWSTNNDTVPQAVTNLSVTLTTIGRPILVALIADGVVRPQFSTMYSDAPGFLILSRDGSEIQTHLVGTSEIPTALVTIVPMAAGTYTFAIYARAGSSGSIYVKQAKLMAFEL